MADAVLCRLADIPDGDCLEVHVGERSFMVARSGANVWAYVNVCPHFSLPLNSQPNEFLVVGERRVMCAYHCAIFRFEDGRCIEGPAEGLGLDALPVEVVAGNVVMKA
jgi:nitrite reductase/ring-hydroxylating ferredoxin subunit